MKFTWPFSSAAIFVICLSACTSSLKFANLKNTGSKEALQDAGAGKVDYFARPGFDSYFNGLFLDDTADGRGRVGIAGGILQDGLDAKVELLHVEYALFGDEIGLTPHEAAVPPERKPLLGDWDFRFIGEYMKTAKARAAGKTNVKFVIRLYAGAPAWWKKILNKAHLEAYQDGCLELNRANADCIPAAGGTVPASLDRTALWRVSLESETLHDHWKVGAAALRNYLAEQGYLEDVVGFVLMGMGSQEWISWSAEHTYRSTVLPMSYGSLHKDSYRAWHTSRFGVAREVPTETEFTAAHFPTRATNRTFLNYATDANVAHYHLYQNELRAVTIGRLAGYLKQQFPKTKVGAIYGYSNEMGGDPSFGHNSLGWLLKNSQLDFINPMLSYADRRLKGADMERQPFTSVQLNNKAVHFDFDVVTKQGLANQRAFCVWAKANSPSGYEDNCEKPDGVTPGTSWRFFYQMHMHGLTVLGQGTPSLSVVEPSDLQDAHLLRRALGFSVARNFNFTYLSLHNDTATHTSFLGNDYLKSITPAVSVAKQNSKSYSAKSVAEVLVVSDEDSTYYSRSWQTLPQYQNRFLDTAGLGTHSLSTPLISLNRMGTSYDHVLMADLKTMDVSQYKLILFLNAWSVSTVDRALFAEKLKKDQRVLMWNYTAGLFKDGSRAVANLEDLVGMGFTASGNSRAPQLQVGASNLNFFSQAFSALPNFVEDCCDSVTLKVQPGVTALANYPASTDGAMGIKDLGAWKSLWTATAALPPAAYRDIARYSGAHIYYNYDEPFYLSASHFTVVPNSTGPRTVRFPRPVTVYEMVGNTLLAKGVTQFTFDALEYGVNLFRYE